MMIKWSELTSEQRDALVAEKIMGLEVVPDPYGRFFSIRGDDLYLHDSPEPYSTDMTAAWKILDQEKFYAYYVHCMKAKDTVLKEDGYSCSLYWIHEDGSVWNTSATATTPQEAICGAALKSYGVEVE